jgi:hypothetical protein
METIISDGRIYLTDKSEHEQSIVATITYICDLLPIGWQRVGSFPLLSDAPQAKQPAIVFTECGVYAINGYSENDVNEFFDTCTSTFRDLFSEAERLFKRQAYEACRENAPKHESLECKDLAKFFKYGGLMDFHVDDFSQAEKKLILLRHGKIDVKPLGSTGKRQRLKTALTNER